ncbi:MAG: helix-turn-helix transcriptional regulator [Ruminococcus sp.]|nr:helix-turn-helix transcriptional regulator [Ruminococcus sp.]
MLKRRKQQGLTQAEVAELANISDRTYADIERGSTNLRVITLVSICSALKTTPNDLLVEDDILTAQKQEILLGKMNKCTNIEKETALKLLTVYLDSL